MSRHIVSSLDDFLAEDGLLEHTTSLTLGTLSNAATALGMRLRIELTA